MVAYAWDICHIISRFDEEMCMWKLCQNLICSMVKKVRSVAWQKQIRRGHAENVEFALIIAEDALNDIRKFKKAARKKRKKRKKRKGLPTLDRTMADDEDEVRRAAGAWHSLLLWALRDAVQYLEERRGLLREATAWSGGLTERSNGDGEEKEEEGDENSDGDKEGGDDNGGDNDGDGNGDDGEEGDSDGEEEEGGNEDGDEGSDEDSDEDDYKDNEDEEGGEAENSGKLTIRLPPLVRRSLCQPV